MSANCAKSDDVVCAIILGGVVSCGGGLFKAFSSIMPSIHSCVAGVNKEGIGGATSSPCFLPVSRSPTLSLFTPATQAIRSFNT